MTNIFIGDNYHLILLIGLELNPSNKILNQWEGKKIK
jgi:hypothetical protein